MTTNAANQTKAIHRPYVLQPVPPPGPYTPIRQVQLKSGNWVALRPAEPADATPLVAMHHRLSALSRYQRYMSPHLPEVAEMEELCRLARKSGEAFVAETLQTPRRIVALIYYVREAFPQDHKAEFGVVVEDGIQGGGLGRALLDHMCVQARRNGVRLMEANVLPQNKQMLHLLDSSMWPLRKSLSADFVTATLDIGLDDADLYGSDAQLMCLLADAAASPLPAAHLALCP